MNDGAAAEIAVVGNEGMVGIALSRAAGARRAARLVQSAGRAYRLEAALLKADFAGGRPAAAAAAALHPGADHGVDADRGVQPPPRSRAAAFRWLLLSLDWLPSSELVMTQQLIVDMLGVRREGVTETCRLQPDGLDQLSRNASASARQW